MKHGKTYRAASAEIDRNKEYEPAEAIAFLKGKKFAKFDEAVEVHMRLSISPKKSGEAVRSTVVLPNGTGRSLKVAVVTGTKEKEAKEAKADVVGGEDLIAKIKDGKMLPGTHFDIVVATPEMMPKLAQVAKILGPKGMMPSPKTETVTQKVGETVEALKKGAKASFKNDDSGNIHQIIGKLSFGEKELLENFTTFLDAVHKAKPEGLKGRLILRTFITTTMGPSLKIKA